MSTYAHPGMLAAALLLAACSPKDPAQMKAGDELYDYYCRSCHAEHDLGGRLEKLPESRRSLKPYELVLMMHHRYESPARHPDIHLPQLSPEQADAIAQYAYKLRYQGN